MSRLLSFIAIFAIILWFFRQRSQAAKKPATHADKPAENIVACATCGVHQPLSESFSYQGKYYCSNAHLQSALATKQND